MKREWVDAIGIIGLVVAAIVAMITMGKDALPIVTLVLPGISGIVGAGRLADARQQPTDNAKPDSQRNSGVIPASGAGLILMATVAPFLRH